MNRAEFDTYRSFIFSIAYRMLGNAVDAEDIVQETFVRLERAETGTIDSPRSYVATIATRLSIDQLRSTRSRRQREERIVLPEPLPSGLVLEPRDPVALAESLSFAFLVMLERLSPLERAVFLLREVFDFEYSEIATVLGRSEESCRQTLRRARRHVADERPRFRPRPDAVAALAARFAQACGASNVEGLLAILAPDVSLHVDGGTDRAAYGRVRALARPLAGAEVVAHFLVSVQAQAPAFLPSIEEVNGAPAIVARDGDRTVGIICFEATDDRIYKIFIVNDPELLRRFGPPSPPSALPVPSDGGSQPA